MSLLLLSLGLLLAVAHVLGGLARRLRQPAIIGELAAGIILGPTVLGALNTSVQESLYPASGPLAFALDGIIGNELFIARVVMAMITSMMAGPAIKIVANSWSPESMSCQRETSPTYRALHKEGNPWPKSGGHTGLPHCQNPSTN